MVSHMLYASSGVHLIYDTWSAQPPHEIWREKVLQGSCLGIQIVPAVKESEIQICDTLLWTMCLHLKFHYSYLAGQLLELC